ncbi:transporter substrate-binding domain-containing protein [Streptosporangium amethystogenes]|uniref:transporter substrate-binding domain-containing protein n=1 Tax=Streptosporangium amethystogenes TaxID=2002 RepID=UPI000A058CB9|nr:transporter substrate-binding domain-containing protein [Streptosporangium amethystogenes]
MADAGDETKGTSGLGLVRRELFWVVPLVLATLATTGLLFLNLSDGIGFATILAVPIGIAGVGVAVLAIRLANQPQISGGKLQGRPNLVRLVSIIAAVALLVLWSVNVIWPNRDSVEYLRGRTVKIGINGDIPGWSKGAGQKASGFDTAVGDFLLEKLGFDNIKYIPVNPGDRETKLKDGEVDLIIASYSITLARKRLVDFAGPYYIDFPAISYDTVKRGEVEERGERPNVCITSGTTAESDLKLDYEIVKEVTIDKCMVRFFNSADPVVGVATDRSILDTYIGSQKGDRTRFDTINLSGEVEIGVGVKNNHPNLCKGIGKALNDFISTRWREVFKNNLDIYMISEKGHMPPRTDPVHCENSE